MTTSGNGADRGQPGQDRTTSAEGTERFGQAPFSNGAGRPDDADHRYSTEDTTRGRVKRLVRAGRHTPREGENIRGHVLRETVSVMRATQRRQITPSRRVFRRRARRAVRTHHRHHDSAVTDRFRLAHRRLWEIHWEVLANGLITAGMSGGRSGLIKAATKALVVLGEMMVVGAALRTLLRIQPWQAGISSIGISLALLALPALASKLARADQARKLLTDTYTDREIPRMMWEHAVRYLPNRKSPPWAPYLAYGAVLTVIAGSLGLLVSLTPGDDRPAVKGLATAVVLVATGVGVAAIEYRLTSLEGELVRSLRRQAVKARRLTNRTDRWWRARLPRISRADAELTLLDAAVGLEVDGRRSAALSEASVAGARIGDEVDDPFGPPSELIDFVPRRWRAGPRDIGDDLALDADIVAALREELTKLRRYQLEPVLVTSGQPARIDVRAPAASPDPAAAPAPASTDGRS